MTDHFPATVPVLVAGGGVTGLSAAVFLARFGVPPLVVERRAVPATDPRARALNPRTVELYRMVGLEEAVLATRSPVAEHTVVAHAETLVGPELMRLPNRLGPDTEGLSPCGWAAIDQNQLEPLLRADAVAAGADVRDHTEVVAVVDGPAGVEVTVRDHDTGTEHRVVAEHLVAADGAHSPVRAMLGIPHDGPGTIARKINVYFEADLDEPLAGRKIVALTLRNAAVHGFLTSIDGVRRWRFAISLRPEEGAAEFTEARCVELLKAAIGVDVPVVVDRISGSPWEIRGQSARRMRVGRVLVAGDAAHTMPPVGTFGVATGVQDAFNLAWKIGLHHGGLAGPGLLDTYETERLPVAQETTRLTVDRYELVNGKPGNPRESAARQRMMMFGHTYPEGAFVPEAAVVPGALEDPDHPSGAPGSRAPHVPLERDGTPLSTVDLLDVVPVLFAGPAGAGWAEAAAEVARASGVPVRCHHVGRDVVDVTGRFTEVYGIAEDGAVLVRPDGFVAWRTTGAAADRVATLAEVVDRVLFR
ncbi:FAD-dependent monooxygenase [Umezawaea sp.]|uniref:FAD-dependent monooxygenase n=1 Tax=Umezawaea sp. TaxID=1955258 RepID=UPI002ED68695